MIPEKFWPGKRLLVTGGSSGIGRAICLAAAAAGGRVGLLARRADAVADTVAEIRSAGGIAEGRACDTTAAADVPRTVAALESALGPCDVAIACAGIHRESWPLDAAAARDVLDVNLGGAAEFLAAVLPGMLARGRGHICGVASIAAILGLPGNAAYCASKAGLLVFLESLRIDCEPAGVLVTAACPGVVDTPMVTDEERAAGGLVSAAAAAERILRGIERGEREIWFPRRTWLAARLARALPPRLRAWAVRGTPRMREAPRRGRIRRSRSAGGASSPRGSRRRSR